MCLCWIICSISYSWPLNTLGQKIVGAWFPFWGHGVSVWCSLIVSATLIKLAFAICFYLLDFSYTIDHESSVCKISLELDTCLTDILNYVSIYCLIWIWVCRLLLMTTTVSNNLLYQILTDIYSGVIQNQRMEGIIWYQWMTLHSVHCMFLPI